MVLVVLRKILQAVEPGTIGDPITVPAKFTLAPSVLMPPSLTRLSYGLVGAPVLMVPVHMVRKPALAPG